MSIDLLEEAVNALSDHDGSWWPFLWLRPDKTTHLSLGRLVSLAVLYGAPCGALMVVLLALLGPRARPAIPLAMVGFPMVFLFLGSVVVGPMWNRRADRLRARQR